MMIEVTKQQFEALGKLHERKTIFDLSQSPDNGCLLTSNGVHRVVIDPFGNCFRREHAGKWTKVEV